MEVHPHTHSRRKKWIHYFWEFVMLFLAVFCGFLAEYQLEHKIEKDRERQYVTSLLQDLRKDTVNLIVYIEDHEYRFKKFDSLLNLLISGDYKKRGNDIYYFARFVTRGEEFWQTDGTIQQLKSSGGLRMIRNRKVVDSLLSYDISVRIQVGLDERFRQRQMQFSVIAGEVFNGAVFYKMVNPSFSVQRSKENYQLITENPVLINKTILQLQYVATGTNFKKSKAIELQSKARRLIEMIKLEYHLK